MIQIGESKIGGILRSLALSVVLVLSSATLWGAGSESRAQEWLLVVNKGDRTLSIVDPETAADLCEVS